MTLEQLISFQLLSSSLSLKEFKTLSTSIFTHFYSELQTKNEYYHKQPTLTINDLNHKISEIIQKRDTKHRKNELKIDKIPKTMIQNISSYLPLKSYSKFELCNRTIFVSLRTPSMLYEVNTNDMGKYINPKLNKTISMNRFKSVGKLVLNKENAEYIKSRKWNNLHHLTIDNNDLYFEHLNDFKNIFNWNKIKRLDFFYDYYTNYDIEFEIIAKCKNLEYMEFVEMDDCYPQCIASPFIENIKGLALFESDSIDEFVKDRRNKLQSLHINRVGYRTMDTLIEKKCGDSFIFNVDFKKLKEIHLDEVMPNDIVSFIKTARNLERIRISDQLYFFQDAKDGEIGSMIQEIWKIDSLNYFGIDCTSDLFEELMEILSETVRFIDKNKSIKLELSFIWTPLDHDNVGDVLLKLINIMDQWFDNDFMVIVSFEMMWKSEEKMRLKMLECLLVEMSERFCIGKEINDKRQRVIISNKGNTFSGYKSRWFMDCSFCHPYF